MISRCTVSLAGHLENERVLNIAVGGNGSLIILSISAQTAAQFGATERYRGCWYFTNGLHEPYDATVSIIGERTQQVIKLSGLKAWCPQIEVLPQGEILVVNGRCDVRNEQDNAFVYGRNGRLLRSFPLGDGIKHVQTLPDGRIWVGYFDEGIFGNTGWKTKPWVHEAATNGLACFDSVGRLLWRYRPPPDGNHISDCAALNATDAGVWACTYTNYPVTRIQPDGTVHYWENSFPGVQAIAVAGSRLMLWDGGSLPEDEVRCTIQRIDGDELIDLHEVVLELPNGTPLDGRMAIVLGRGSQLHAFHGTDWHRFDLSDPSSSLRKNPLT